jgi:hypothetical protein
MKFPCIYTFIGAFGSEMWLRESLFAMEVGTYLRPRVRFPCRGFSPTLSFSLNSIATGKSKFTKVLSKLFSLYVDESLKNEFFLSVYGKIKLFRKKRS